MNLWAKSFGRFAILAVALFFFSCEDETSFLGFRNPNKKFDVSYLEIDIPTSVLSIDSVVTDNYGTILNGSPFNAVGAYSDPLTGTLRAETYLQLSPSSTTKLEENAEFDSLTIQLRLNFYSYGFMGQQQMQFNLHEITGEVLSLDTLKKRYYSNSAVQYNTSPVGQASIFVNKASLDTVKRDTVLLIKGKLDEAYGRRLFDLALTDPGFTFSDRNLFIQEIKGLVITPTENSGILGFNPVHSSSKIVLHYHRLNEQNETDTLERSFVFNKAEFNPNFTNYSTDRTATELASITQSYQPVQPGSGMRAVQNGSPLITKLDLTRFYDFADTLENILVNSAELVISNVASPEGMEAHRSLMLVMMNNDDNLFTLYNNETAGSFGNYYLYPQGRRFYVHADATTSQATLNYNPEEDEISGFITLFAQSLFRNKNDKQGNISDSRIKYLALFPLDPFIAGSVHRTVFNASNIKLRINYTMPAAVSNNNN